MSSFYADALRRKQFCAEQIIRSKNIDLTQQNVQVKAQNEEVKAQNKVMQEEVDLGRLTTEQQEMVK